MKVRSATTAHTGQVIDVTLEDSDGELQWKDKWTALPVWQRFKALQALADVFVLTAMYEHELIGEDSYSSKIAELKFKLAEAVK
jgi:hypothetical protein